MSLIISNNVRNNAANSRYAIVKSEVRSGNLLYGRCRIEEYSCLIIFRMSDQSEYAHTTVDALANEYTKSDANIPDVGFLESTS